MESTTAQPTEYRDEHKDSSFLSNIFMAYIYWNTKFKQNRL